MCAISPLLNASLVDPGPDVALDTAPAEADTPAGTHVCAAVLAAQAAARELAISAA